MKSPEKYKYWDTHLDPGNLKEKEINVGKYISFLECEEELSFAINNWKKESIVVDLGTGLGQYAIYLAQNGYKVIALDISFKRLKILKKYLEEKYPTLPIYLIQASGENLPFKNNGIDFFFTHSVLIHTDIKKTLQEIKFSMKKGASFIEPSIYNPFVNIYRKFFAPREWKKITNYFTQKTLQHFLETFENGYSIQIRTYHFFNFLSYFWEFAVKNKKLFCISSKIIGKIDSFLSNVKNKYFWMYVIKVSCKK